MKEERFFYVPSTEENEELPLAEATHALKVLRLQEGDEMFLMDGAGTFYRAQVSMTTNHRCFYNIIEKQPQEKTWHGKIHVAVAPTKNADRVEWFVEKATEVGFDEVSLLHTKFTERKIMKATRLAAIITSAVKQSRKPYMPWINTMVEFKKFMEQPRAGRKFICHCYNEFPKKDFFTELKENVSPDEEITVLIGPEGDFSVDEVALALKNGYESVSLGQSRLRTETAALMAVAYANLAKRKE
jgi:16S rRNA (uracil1498-N3)-methyltransferase